MCAHTLTPWLVRWEEAIRYAFIEPDEGLNCEFPTTTLLRGDAAARPMYYHNGILDGWMTRNEARLMENLNPLEGLDEPMRPLNMVEEDEAEATNSDDDPTRGNLDDPAQPDEDATVRRWHPRRIKKCRRCSGGSTGDVEAHVHREELNEP